MIALKKYIANIPKQWIRRLSYAAFRLGGRLCPKRGVVFLANNMKMRAVSVPKIREHSFTAAMVGHPNPSATGKRARFRQFPG